MAFKQLTGHKSLISLDIGNMENTSKNKIGEKAVPKLVEFLQKSKIIQFLNLRSTVLGDPGLTMLSDGLKNNKTIFNLNVAKNDLTVNGIEAFAKVLVTTQIQELDISFNPLGNVGITELATIFTRQHSGKVHGYFMPRCL